MSDSVNMIALTKDGERFVFLYDDASPSELLRTFGQYAADPELNFSWYDAAVLSQRVRASQQQSPDTAAAELPNDLSAWESPSNGAAGLADEFDAALAEVDDLLADLQDVLHLPPAEKNPAAEEPPSNDRRRAA